MKILNLLLFWNLEFVSLTIASHNQWNSLWALDCVTAARRGPSDLRLQGRSLTGSSSAVPWAQRCFPADATLPWVTPSQWRGTADALRQACSWDSRASSDDDFGWGTSHQSGQNFFQLHRNVNLPICSLLPSLLHRGWTCIAVCNPSGHSP